MQNDISKIKILLKKCMKTVFGKIKIKCFYQGYFNHDINS